MDRLTKVYEAVKELCEAQLQKDGDAAGVTTVDIAVKLNIQRTNASSDLNILVRQGKLARIKGKPVKYRTNLPESNTAARSFSKSILDEVIGANDSLKIAVQQAKAAAMYPELGLNTLLLGPTGVGKSMFAGMMFQYACEIGQLNEKDPFVVFNCADYANNPQLLISQLFGVKKGAYTGADKDREGLVKKADGGILFLDEVHRLPPEGQEMLFYLIDRGLYRGLGEVDELHKAKVMIICATTEKIQSALLETFIRRIPMVINIPPLNNRTANERWQLIRLFVKQETANIKRSITVTSGALKAFLFYDCPNNIGQLKNDIKISCAKAFLNYKLSEVEEVIIRTEDLPEHVRNGLLDYKRGHGIIEKIGLRDDDVLFTQNKDEIIHPAQKESFNIYEKIDKKMDSLKKAGLSNKDIWLVVSIEMESYIKRYFANVAETHFDKLYNVVDKEIVELTKDFLEDISRKANRHFPDKVLYGLSMHVSSTLQRIKNGKSAANLYPAEIKASHPVLFEFSANFCTRLNQVFQIDVPEEEAGVLTMLLAMDYSVEEQKAGRVGIIVAMHGESCATSMADVVNELLDTNHAVGYNMPLNQSPKIALERLTQRAIQADEGKGILMLVDMGSLVYFGDLLCESTGIPVKTVEMVSTLMVLEATRKAIMLASLEEVYYAITNLEPYTNQVINSRQFMNPVLDDVIITACITGVGTALMLKNIIEQQIKTQGKKIDIIPLEIINIEQYNKNLSRINKEKNIIMVVSNIKPHDETIPYLSPKALLEDDKSIMMKLLPPEKQGPMLLLNQMKDVIEVNVEIDAERYIDNFKKFYLEITSAGIGINQDVLVGLILHMACAVKRITEGKQLNTTKDEEKIAREYKEDFNIIAKSLNGLEKSFNLKMPRSEIVNIIRLVHFL